MSRRATVRPAEGSEGPLRLVQLFVNTIDVEHGREWWPTPRALELWISERALPAARPTTADLEHARDLREALRALLVPTTVAVRRARRCGS